jgi:hypothetical protein
VPHKSNKIDLIIDAASCQLPWSFNKGFDLLKIMHRDNQWKDRRVIAREIITDGNTT